MLNLEEVFLSRRDTRHFTADPVPDQVLNKALMAGHAAPSVGLTDATRYYIIRSEEVKKNVKELFEEYNEKAYAQIQDEAKKTAYASLKLEAILDAPIGLVVAYDRSVLNDFTIGTVASNDNIKFSAVCAVQNIWLSLTDQGYGMGWVSILNYYQFKKILGLPDEIEPLGYLCIGKPASDYDKQPMLQLMGWKRKRENPIVTEVFETALAPQPELPTKDSETSETAVSIASELQKKIDNKTKPLGSLGVLEKLAKQIGTVFNSTCPQIIRPHMLVFAADHGIAAQGVSAYPQEVTRQMVENFLDGGAAINVFCRQHDIELEIIDAGVNYDFPPNRQIINFKVAKGTKDFSKGPAMSANELQLCFNKGTEITEKVANLGCNTLGFGEMGIGNTSSASVLMSLLCKIPISECIGKGTGLSSDQLERKTEILQRAVQGFEDDGDYLKIMAWFGGFEIMQIAGAMLEAKKRNMLILVDGFICSVAYLCAFRIDPSIKDNAVFSHQSEEKGHQILLRHIGAKPLLNLGMRLGEGSGSAVAFPILKSAVAFLNEMASFESAGVSNKSI